jgi:hypothetical protein
MSEQPAPYTVTPPAPPAHEHVAPSTDPAAAFGLVLRVHKAFAAASELGGALMAIQMHLQGLMGSLSSDDPQCPGFPERLAIIEDELREMADVRARAVSRLKLANEGCPQIKRAEDPKGNGVAS